MIRTPPCHSLEASAVIVGRLFVRALCAGLALAVCFFAGTCFGAEGDGPHLYFGCEIYEVNFDLPVGRRPQPRLIKKMPGEQCLFKGDGSVVLTQTNEVVKYDHRMKKLWGFPTRAHHQINASANLDEILVIGTESIASKEIGSDPARADVLYVLGQDGKIKKRFSLFENRKQIDHRSWAEAIAGKFPLTWTLARFGDVKWELTHTNTFYELVPTPAGTRRQEFQAGNYIINDISLMLTIVIDRDLKQILWQKALGVRPNMIHDTQLLQNGNLLYYDNGTKHRPYGRLVELDLNSGKELWVFPPAPSRAFYAPRLGGVQRLKSGGTLYTDTTKKPCIIELSKAGKEVWTWCPDRSSEYLQQARAADLTQFLKNNKGL